MTAMSPTRSTSTTCSTGTSGSVWLTKRPTTTLVITMSSIRTLGLPMGTPSKCTSHGVDPSYDPRVIWRFKLRPLVSWKSFFCVCSRFGTCMLMHSCRTASDRGLWYRHDRHETQDSVMWFFRSITLAPSATTVAVCNVTPLDPALPTTHQSLDSRQTATASGATIRKACM